MLDPVRAKAKLIAVTATAFTGGILLASGLEWTTGSQASLLQAAPAPSREEIRPVAELNEAFTSIAESVTPAVVTIQSKNDNPQRPSAQQVPPEFREMFPFFQMPDGPPQPDVGTGSGFFISRDGYIMTNNHVVEDATSLRVTLPDRRQLDARVIGRDPTTDIAVIKVEGSGFPTVRLGQSGETEIGEWVLAIGNGLGIGNSVTSGIISAKGRGINIIRESLREQGEGRESYAIEDFLQTDAVINRGNSGGPLVNLRGEVVGVNSAILSPTGFYSGYGFSIPIDLARRVSDDLIRYGRVRRPILGVQIRDVNPEDAEVYRLQSIDGVLVQDFGGGNSPAERSGLRPNDVIVAVDGRGVDQVNQLQSLIRERQPGEEVTLTVIRDGRQQRFRVNLAEAPAPQTVAVRPAQPEPGTVSMGKLGFSFAPLTAAINQRFRLGYRELGGVVVTGVPPYGAAAEVVFPGWKIVEAEGQRITEANQLQRIVGQKRQGQILRLVLQDPDGQRRIANVRVGS